MFKHKNPPTGNERTNKQGKEGIVGLPFITVDSNGKYILHPKAEEFIAGILDPLAVLSIVGKYRTGKSYLLNQVVLDAAPGEGFGVGNTTNAHTRGLLVANKLLKIRQQDGTILNTIVIDTEGIGALDANSTHDSRIFALSLLLSSVLMYNSSGAIDEDALENISLVTNLTKHLRVRGSSSSSSMDGDSKEGGGDTEFQIQGDDDIRKYFPTLVWVLRDFTLKMVNAKNESITSDQYLEQSLTVRPLPREEQDEVAKDRGIRKNKIRSMLCAYFPERACVQLVRPCVEENEIQELDMTNRSLLRREFTDGLNVLRGRLIKLVKPKMICGRTISGKVFLKMCRGFLEAINNNAIPVIRDVCELLSEDRCREAMEESLRVFEKRLARMKVGSGGEVGLKTEMMQFFESRAFGEKIPLYKERLEVAMNGSIQRMEIEYKTQVLSLVRKQLDELEGLIPFPSKWADFHAAWTLRKQQFLTNAPSGSESLWMQESNHRIWKWVNTFTTNLVSAKEVELLTMEVARLQNELRQMTMKVEERQVELLQKTEELNKVIEELQQTKEKLSDKETEHQHLMSLHEGCDRISIQNEQLQHKCAELENQLTHVQTTINDVQDEMASNEEEFKNELQRVKQELLMGMRQAKEIKAKGMQQLQTLRTSLEAELEKRQATLESQNASLHQQEEQLKRFQDKICEDAQVLAKTQREATEKEMTHLYKIQQLEGKLEALEARLTDSSKKLSIELQQRASDKLALLEMRTLQQTVARLEAQNQSLRETNSTNQEMMRQALQRSNTLARQLKNQERKQEVANTAAQMFSARQDLIDPLSPISNSSSSSPSPLWKTSSP